MPLDGQRVVRILMEECSRLPERYAGYRGDVFELLTDILALERQQAWPQTEIQRQIIDKIEAAGAHLRRKQKLVDGRPGETE